MKLNGLRELFLDELKDLYSAESQLVKALPKMAKTASSEQLQTAFTDHLEQTRGHVNRLEQIGEALGIKLTGKKCKAMAGLIKEGAEVIGSEGADDIIDLALIAAAQRVEHYEISAYGSARAIAEQLGNRSAVQLLQETLDEESAADEKLTNIAARDLYPRTNGASAGAGNEIEDEEETLIGQDITPTDELDEDTEGASTGNQPTASRAGKDR
ncbi:MAG TPA: ferritin-like domain-containing protein [Gemmataceae bacterium]|nr:ferritin-like domain-containing protein [Gemmataceae bacterium]